MIGGGVVAVLVALAAVVVDGAAVEEGVDLAALVVAVVSAAVAPVEAGNNGPI